MSSINFYLNKPDRKNECPIMLTYQLKGKKFRYWSKLKTNKKGWGDQRIKINYIGASEKNAILDDLENVIKEIEREALFNKKEFSIETVRRKFELKIGELSSAGNFFQVYDKFINDSRPTKSKATIQTYSATKMKLLSFKEDKGYNVDFESINQSFYDAFLNYLIKDLGFLNNTVGKHIKTLKVFLNYAADNEYCTPITHLKKFKVFREEADIIYLTHDELISIYSLNDLSQTLLSVKDNFCFGCFTGLRFSDISKLTNANIKGEYLEIKTEKTKDFIKVPLNYYAKEILKKYQVEFNDNPLPTGISNQKTNKYLKEIGRLAGLEEMNTIEKFNGSKKIITTKPKYALLTSHTARRTFVTLALEKGIRAEVVMAMTGHKNYKTFKKYIKITDKIMQSEMNRFWNNPLLKVV